MQFDPIRENEPLLQEISRFCERNGLSPTRFGEAALNDKALVRNLRDGRQLLPGTMHRIRSFMAQTEAGSAA